LEGHAAKPAPGVYLADKEDVTQTFIDVGHLGGELKDKDYPALNVAAEILGGGFSSRLFRSVRTAHGWAYSIGASWSAHYDHPGTFHISGSTQSVHTVDTIKAIREEVDKIRTAEVSDEELQTAKDTVLNGFVFNFDRPSKTLNRLMQYEYYGYPRDFIFQYQKAIGAVTKADVLRVAKEHFKPQDFTYVAVGNPKAFGTPLSELGMKVTPIDLTIPEPKAETSKVDPETLAKGKALLLVLQNALGGADKLAAVKDLQYMANVEVQTPGGPGGPVGMKAKQTNSFLLPNTMRQEIELPFGKQQMYSDGSSGWLAGMQGARNLPPPVLAQVRGEIFRQLTGLALSDRDPNRTVNYAGDGTLEISTKSGESARLQVDAKTGLPLKLSYQEGAQSLEDEYSDWRDVAGLHLPFQWTVTQDGKKYADVKIQEYKVNSGLTQEALSKKP
jgi:zinc protease